MIEKQRFHKLIQLAPTHLRYNKSMTTNPTPRQIKSLQQQIAHDQANPTPAEKLVKINVPFDEAVRKMVQTPPLKKIAHSI